MEEGWESIFKKGVLERGRQYYIEGRVELLEYETTHLEAEVFGSEYYNIKIDLNDKQILKMNCTCPYAKENPYCKHMASVLYAVENSKIILKENTIEDNSIDEILDSLSKKNLKELLKDLLKNNDNLREFKLKYKTKLSKEDEDYYINKIRIIFSFEGWENIEKHESIIENINIRLLEFIEEDFQLLLKYEKYYLIFNLFKEISDNLNLIIEKHESLENYTDINELSKNSLKIINTLMKKDLSESLENEIFEYSLCYLKNSNTNNNMLLKFYENIFLHKFEGPYYLLKKEEFLNSEIEKNEKNDNLNRLKTLLLLKYRLLKLEGYNEEEISKLLSEYHLKLNMNDETE
ncbi:SWIM zinc finger domain-containing protein [uncultured Methanobrevibacter sp.]|uniref:SWIM zinc finger family protein n=1 Tax=uncultured Methanobrevibacter sp. TaxID=253161 RepID=UPI0025CE3251|nr:SWIM zinc finger family protein [uncultured Methanobrevibacter sp.]